MPEKINVEVIVGKPGRREGEGKKDSSAPSRSTEAEGYYMPNTGIICLHCGSHRVIPIDTDSQQWYTCGNCGGAYYY